jgi:signal transduction histidine kinase
MTVMHAPNTVYAVTVIATSDFGAVGDTLTTSAGVHPSTLVSKLADDFFKQSDLDSVAVVDGGRPLGLITRQKFLFTVFRRFGWEVFGRKPVSELTDKNALVIEANVRLDDALARAVDRRADDAYDELIVVDGEGRYLGLLSVRQMIIQHSTTLANILMQKDLADARARELEKVGEIKSQFLANVTHELRSPVNAIIELTELVRMAAESGFAGQMRDRLSLLLSSATNLRAIITNILDLSKMEAGKMQLIEEEFALVPLLREVVETTRVLAGAKPIEVVLVSESARTVFTDPVKVRQVIINLTSNAVKFTEAGRVVIEQWYDTVGRSIVIRVIDSGIGIRDEDVDRLFEAFTQLEDARSKSHEGTGLGLTITRELIHLLGGRISVESEFGRGTTFTVDIPDRKEQDT